MTVFGRTAEQARLQQLGHGLRAGRSFAVLLEGPAGIGKTTLLDDAAADLGVAVARTVGHEAETHIPYAALLDLTGPLLHLRDRLERPQVDALASAFALDAAGAPADPFAVPAALLALLGAAAEDGPLLVIVDDAHWLDDASRDAVLFVASRLEAEGVGILIAARDGEGRPYDQPELERVALGGLDDRAARDLLADGRPLAPDLVEALIAAGEGNPLALRELARAVARDEREGRGAFVVPPRTRAAAQALFARRLDSLAPSPRRALCLLAAAGGDGPDTVSAGLAALGLPPDALSTAEAAGLIDRDGFRHPLLASAAYHGEADTERRAVHRALAGVTAHPGRRAWHLSAAAAGPDEAAATALEGVAAAAGTRGAHRDAARAAARAAELSPGAGDRGRRRLQAARQYVMAGETGSAVALAATIVVDDPGLEPQTSLLRAEVAVRDGRPDEAVTLLETRARVAAEAGDRAGAAQALLQQSLAHMFTGDMRALVATGERAGAQARGHVPELAALADLIRGEGLAALGADAEAAPLLAGLPALTADDEPALELAEVIAMGALCSAWLERFDVAQVALDTLIAHARRRGAAGRLAYPLAVRSHLGWRRGRWRAAAADAEEAVRLARATGQLGVLAAALPAGARVDASAGRFESAREQAGTALAQADAAGAEAVALWALAALGYCELAAGRPDSAVAPLERAAAIAAGGLGQPALTMFAADHVEALVRVRREDDARAALRGLEATAARGTGTWAHAAGGRCAVLLAEDDEIDERATAARAWHARAPLPFEAARTELAIGERLRRAARRGDARPALETALTTFTRLGAGPWAQRARQELDAAGAPPPGRGRPAAPADAEAGELTARELQIALLVSEGHTNRQVAASLFLSPKTVEHHLGAIYRKLGLRSRTQLATFMAEAP
ncbi:hypothetical protein DSM112329_02483 [Paraconexibacter sp. AEG42_29]|uniref:HTH luxR-type domain-containing protein n=1 Tax=Paraconexibacter sp. AEG42_29 TaxID=2997339 RepID=A0AAU7AVG9_9ACTN